MTGRRVAVIEWALGAALVVWFFVFLALTQVPVEMVLGIDINSIFIAPGLVVSLGINGAVHFGRTTHFTRAEHIMLGIEALVIVLLVVASLVDQANYGPHTGIGSGFGHWLDWFMPLWLLIGPVALTVLILGLVNRSRPQAPATPSA